MKHAVFIASLILSALTHGENMKLVNQKTGFVVVEFSKGKVQFYDRFLEVEMKEAGILIPSSMRKEFGEKEVVYFGDPLFEKAFVEIYYPLCISNSVYQWENDNTL